MGSRSNRPEYPRRVRAGVDIGGTFTDFVVFDEATGKLETFKRLSTPDDPSRAVIGFFEEPEHGTSRKSRGTTTVVHGSTVATNAVLERKGARTALLTSRGFKDLLAIGRQNRSHLYDLTAARPRPLVPRDLCYEVTERVACDGKVLVSLNEAELHDLVRELKTQDVESVAVSLLFSFLHPEHERTATRALRSAGLSVSTSSEILPEFREYERASTVTVNAYVSPVVERYLDRLGSELAVDDLRIMQSNGGHTRAVMASFDPVRSILSGPAAGVVAAVHVARAAGFEQCICFDMGGTSTDVSLADGKIRITSETEIGDLPIRIPAVEIHTVGAGGGSIASVDAGGALRVGPQSAGAEPGPVCYGRGGDRPTVTDAHVVLGRLAADRFLGGELPLDVPAAAAALERLGEEAGLAARTGLDLARTAALGVVGVSTARMERALRRISLERGHDPRDFVLVSFGGAGGLHACDLARGLGIRTVLVPPGASTLSAYGMLAADVVRDQVQTVMLPGETPVPRLERLLEPLVERGEREIAKEGVPPGSISVHRLLDMRYVGQGYEVTIPFGGDFVGRFHRTHEKVYGHAEPSAPVEVVNLRVRVVGEVAAPPLPEEETGPTDPSPAVESRREVVVTTIDHERAEPVQVPFYDGAKLHSGHAVSGPAVIVHKDTTVYLSRADHATVDRHLNLVIEVHG